MSSLSRTLGAAAAIVAGASTIGWQRAAPPPAAALGPPAAPASPSLPATASTAAVGAPAGEASTLPGPPAPLDGSWVFRARGCATCHDGPETEAPFGANFPDLSEARAWAGSRRPGLDARQYLAESIRLPSAFRSPAANRADPNFPMPALDLTDGEIAAVVTYLLGH